MTDYSKDLADDICERLSKGEALTKICEGDYYPNEATVRMWDRENKDGFHTKYVRAREDQGEYYAQRVVEVGEGVLSKDHAPDAGRVAIDAFKWSAGKLNGKYNDKVTIAGDPENPMTLVISPIDKLKKVLGNQAARLTGPDDDEDA